MVLAVVVLNTLLYLQTMTYDIQFNDQALNKKYDAIISMYERDMQKVDYRKSARLLATYWPDYLGSAQNRLKTSYEIANCSCRDSSHLPMFRRPVSAI